MRLKGSPEKVITRWLESSFRDPACFGLIAEVDGEFAGFLLARVDTWESVPPIVQSRKLGIIDGAYVIERFRGHRVAASLIERALFKMGQRNAVAVETTYEAANEASTEMWRQAGFAPWMVHTYRMLYNT
jgi:GNAT superfamily N-acetyltransferase